MPHEAPLITTMAGAFVSAWLLGMLAQKVGLSPIVGYLLAGVVIGPYTPGFVGDAGSAAQLAEIGVVLLMFGVGLHFHLEDLLAVKGIAVPGALLQTALATLLGIATGSAFGWPARSGLVLGIAMAVASTVVLMRVLESRQLMDTVHGHVAVGWLIVEDVLTVIVLVVIPVLSARSGPGSAGLLASVAIALVKLAALVALVLLAGSRVIPWLLVQAARLQSRELLTLTVLALALAVVLVGKPLCALTVVAALGYSVRTGLVVALGLAQIGEFSFILGELATGRSGRASIRPSARPGSRPW
jgi:CPA2 family monovalent cation:H+ antiporter-2